MPWPPGSATTWPPEGSPWSPVEVPERWRRRTSGRWRRTSTSSRRCSRVLARSRRSSRTSPPGLRWRSPSTTTSSRSPWRRAEYAASASRRGSTGTSHRTSSATASASTSRTPSVRTGCWRGAPPGSWCSRGRRERCRRSSRRRLVCTMPRRTRPGRWSCSWAATTGPSSPRSGRPSPPLRPGAPWSTACTSSTRWRRRRGSAPGTECPRAAGPSSSSARRHEDDTEAHLVGGSLAPGDVAVLGALERRQQVPQLLVVRARHGDGVAGPDVEGLVERDAALVVEVPHRDVEHPPGLRRALVDVDRDGSPEEVHVPRRGSDRGVLPDRSGAALDRPGREWAAEQVQQVGGGGVLTEAALEVRDGHGAVAQPLGPVVPARELDGRRQQHRLQGLLVAALRLGETKTDRALVGPGPGKEVVVHLDDELAACRKWDPDVVRHHPFASAGCPGPHPV